MTNYGFSNRFLRFILLGGIAAAANFLSRFGWSHLLPFSAAVLAAYVTGMVVAFILFRTFVFPQSPMPMHRQISGFVLVNLLGMAQVWLVSLILAEHLLPALGLNTWFAETLGHGTAILVPVFTSYLGHKHLTFRGHQK